VSEIVSVSWKEVPAGIHKEKVTDPLSLFGKHSLNSVQSLKMSPFKELCKNPEYQNFTLQHLKCLTFSLPTLPMAFA